MCVPACVCACKGQKVASDPSELKLEVVTSCLIPYLVELYKSRGRSFCPSSWILTLHALFDSSSQMSLGPGVGETGLSEAPRVKKHLAAHNKKKNVRERIS